LRPSFAYLSRIMPRVVLFIHFAVTLATLQDAASALAGHHTPEVDMLAHPSDRVTIEADMLLQHFRMDFPDDGVTAPENCLKECKEKCSDDFFQCNSACKAAGGKKKKKLCRKQCKTSKKSCKKDCLTTCEDPSPLLARSPLLASGMEWDMYVAFKKLREAGHVCPGGREFGPNSEELVFQCDLWRDARDHSKDMAMQNMLLLPQNSGIKHDYTYVRWSTDSGISAEDALKQVSDWRCNFMLRRNERFIGVGFGTNASKNYWMLYILSTWWTPSMSGDNEDCLEAEWKAVNGAHE